ncbi:MAG: hypothetical protein ACRDPW_09905, partial [Mycobacteriales bacterium]
MDPDSLQWIRFSTPAGAPYIVVWRSTPDTLVVAAPTDSADQAAAARSGMQALLESVGQTPLAVAYPERPVS